MLGNRNQLQPSLTPEQEHTARVDELWQYCENCYGQNDLDAIEVGLKVHRNNWEEAYTTAAAARNASTFGYERKTGTFTDDSGTDIQAFKSDANGTYDFVSNLGRSHSKARNVKVAGEQLSMFGDALGRVEAKRLEATLQAQNKTPDEIKKAVREASILRELGRAGGNRGGSQNTAERIAKQIEQKRAKLATYTKDDGNGNQVEITGANSGKNVLQRIKAGQNWFVKKLDKWSDESHNHRRIRSFIKRGAAFTAGSLALGFATGAVFTGGTAVAARVVAGGVKGAYTHSANTRAENLTSAVRQNKTIIEKARKNHENTADATAHEVVRAFTKAAKRNVLKHRVQFGVRVALGAAAVFGSKYVEHGAEHLIDKVFDRVPDHTGGSAVGHGGGSAAKGAPATHSGTKAGAGAGASTANGTTGTQPGNGSAVAPSGSEAQPGSGVTTAESEFSHLNATQVDELHRTWSVNPDATHLLHFDGDKIVVEGISKGDNIASLHNVQAAVTFNTPKGPQMMFVPIQFHEVNGQMVGSATLPHALAEQVTLGQDHAASVEIVQMQDGHSMEVFSTAPLGDGEQVSQHTFGQLLQTGHSNVVSQAATANTTSDVTSGTTSAYSVNPQNIPAADRTAFLNGIGGTGVTSEAAANVDPSTAAQAVSELYTPFVEAHGGASAQNTSAFEAALSTLISSHQLRIGSDLGWQAHYHGQWVANMDIIMHMLDEAAKKDNYKLAA